MRTLSFLFIALLGIASSATPALALDRPPQFVMLAFDNCQENGTWQEISDFVDQMNATNKDTLHFTFFLSAVGLLTDKSKMVYVDPIGRAGKSNIDFGGSTRDVLKRIAWLNKMRGDGNEIGSHAVGHFSGKSWTADQWRHEIQQFDNIIDHVVENNGFTGPQAALAKLDFTSKDIVGFRAPYLDGNKELDQVLEESGFEYDTSDTSEGWDFTTWPRHFSIGPKLMKLWNFGLSFLTLQYTFISESDLALGHARSKRTGKLPAMDYNFCYDQTGGCPDKDPFAAEADQDALEMYNAYAKAFLANYNGNRAPLHIGHHFQHYRGGAYNRALFQFAKMVCGLPEVRCTTYNKLNDFMTAIGPAGRSQFQKGDFPKAPTISFDWLPAQ